MISAPKHLSRDSGPYDDPRSWVPDMHPPLFDIQEFQRRVDSLGARGAVKILWAPRWREWKPRAVGESVTDETVPAHVALYDSDGRPVAPPRWMAVERLEPEQWLPNWEKNRWRRDPSDGLLYDLRGPAPEERFQFLFTIAEHDDHCCAKRREEMFVCWGYFRNPNESDLLNIKSRWSKSLSDPVDPHRSVEAMGETQHERDVASEMRNERLQRKEDNRLRAREVLKRFQPSELTQLLAAAKQRYCVDAPGQQIHQAVEKTQEQNNDRSVRAA